MTINRDTNSLDAVKYSLLGGQFLVRLRDRDAEPGKRFGDVLDDTGEVIGNAYDSTYGGRGFAVYTGPFGGFVPTEQIVFVE